MLRQILVYASIVLCTPVFQFQDSGDAHVRMLKCSKVLFVIICCYMGLLIFEFINLDPLFTLSKVPT